MWLLFDMTNPRILHTAKDPVELRFEEDELPPHLAVIMDSRIEALDDPLFLCSSKYWTELKLRRLYLWLKINPPLTPTKMDNETIFAIRLQIRSVIAQQLRIELSGLPALVAPVVVISAPSPTPRAPRLPNARKGTVGPLIHRIATEMWEAEGSPRDTTVILALRQKIMKVLHDEHKIKMSTSSNELGRWQKQLVTIKNGDPHI
jgi:hypothetical protein